jgi:hypothetical protein
MPPIPELAGVVAGLAVIASAAGVCARQTEQPSLPNVAVTAPAARSQRPTKRIMQNAAAAARRRTV